ncbi:MAG TPA: NAD-dependent epimerase/dehydratase family protein [Geobacteraceae bacterium]
MNSPVNAIVTGATGFLGAALVSRLLASGGRVAVIARQDSPNLKRLPSHPDLLVVHGDFSDVGAWQEPLAGFPAEVFYHLAWNGVGNKYRNDPMQIANIDPSLETLRLARTLGCRRWVGTGSQAEYGPLNRRISENDPPAPSSLYGAAKAATCLLTQVMGKQLGVEPVWARVFSTYGPGDNSGWMLVDVIRQLLNGQRPALTPGEQLWDYLYVDDAAAAMFAMGKAASLSGVYNLGSGQSQSIRSIAEMARDLINPQLPLGFGEIPYRPDQVMHLEADIDKLTRDTGWRPRVSLESGIGNLIEWIKGAVMDDMQTDSGKAARRRKS